ncbi:MAG: hypothetical protein ABI782_05325 [Anaerolineaceae bacterium]
MTPQATPHPRRAWLLPAAVIAILVMVVAATLGLAWQLNRDTLPAAPPTFRAPAPSIAVSVYEVKEANAGGLVLASADGTDVRVPRPSSIDAVVQGGSLKAGDWVNVIGIVDEVRNFSIRAILVLPEHGAAGADGVARTPSGFSGLETRRDPAERIIIGGQVIRFNEGQATLLGPSGEVALTVRQDAQLFRVEKGDPAGIRAGDRLASTRAAVADVALAAALVSVQVPLSRTELSPGRP